MAKTYDGFGPLVKTVREALKGDQHKLDHDKDGDIDGKDFEALRNKKKKKKSNDNVEMNPKLDNGKGDKAEQKEAVKYPHMMYDPKTGKEVTAKTPMDHNKYTKMGYTHKKEQKESTMSIRDKLIAVLEGDRSAHYKGATKPQDYEEILGTGPGAKKMIDDHKPAPVDPKFDGNVAAKATAEAGKKTNQSKKRSNDNDKGDKKIVNPVSGAKTESVNNIMKAYASMHKKKEIKEDPAHYAAIARNNARKQAERDKADPEGAKKREKAKAAIRKKFDKNPVRPADIGRHSSQGGGFIGRRNESAVK